ncbi:MAG: hypothetical protein KGH67_05480, partial [Candidatus Micrarchaeota archaeon]|nr:hypothetical protein [Candidatus Micrarchaeota archaeon]
MMNPRKVAFIAVLVSLLAAGVPMAQLNGCQSGTGINSVAYNFANWYCSDINPAVSSVWANWLPVMALVVTVAISIATVIFMFGTALKNERLRTFGVAEIYEAMATAIMVGFFLFLTAVMFGLLPAMTAGPIDPYNAALTYIATTINTTSTTSSNLFNVA